MKHMMDLEVILAEGMRELGLDLPAGASAQLLGYLETVLRLNATLNLTRIVDPAEAVRLHLIDSLAALPEVNASPGGEMLDIGTGGGFPGVPLAIATGRITTLLDSVAKKAVATQQALDEVGLACARAVACRAEELAAACPSRFAVVVARAVAPLPSLIELAAPLLVVGGRLVALKGEPTTEELDSGNAVAEMTGMYGAAGRPLALPSGGEGRTILVYEKTGPSRTRLPRRTGLAQKRPLG